MSIMWRLNLVPVVLVFTILPMWSEATAQVIPGCGQPSQVALTDIHDNIVGKRVVGGAPTTTMSFPWTVLIKRYGHSGIVCTGAILSTRLVLTAAHCFDAVNQYDIYLWVGKDELDFRSAHESLYFVERVIRHDLYNQTTKNNDIALIQTTGAVRFSSNVRPVCLPDLHASLPLSTYCLLAGYGDTLGTGTERRLNYIQVPMVSSAQCAQEDWLGTDFQAVVGASFCAGYADGGPDACSGDSGAALVSSYPTGHSYHVYGIASWGKGCGERRKPGVYTRVSAFVDWITAHLTVLGRQH